MSSSSSSEEYVFVEPTNRQLRNRVSMSEEHTNESQLLNFIHVLNCIPLLDRPATKPGEDEIALANYDDLIKIIGWWLHDIIARFEEATSHIIPDLETEAEELAFTIGCQLFDEALNRSSGQVTQLHRQLEEIGNAEHCRLFVKFAKQATKTVRDLEEEGA